MTLETVKVVPLTLDTITEVTADPSLQVDFTFPAAEHQYHVTLLEETDVCEQLAQSLQRKWNGSESNRV